MNEPLCEFHLCHNLSHLMPSDSESSDTTITNRLSFQNLPVSPITPSSAATPPSPHSATFPSPICGYLSKHTSNTLKSWKKRYFQADPISGNIFYFKNQRQAKSPNLASGCIDLTTLKSVMELPESKNGFGMRLLTSQKIWELAAETREERDKWVEYFNAVLHREASRAHEETAERLRRIWQEEQDEREQLFLQEHDEAIEELQEQHAREIDQLKQELEQQQDHYKSIHQSLEQKNQTLLGKTRELEQQLTVKEAIIDQDTIQLTLHREQIDKLRTELQKVRETLDKTVSQLKSARKDTKRAKLELQLFKSEIEKDQESMSALRRELEVQSIRMKTERDMLDHDRQNNEIEKEANEMLRLELEKKKKKQTAQQEQLTKQWDKLRQNQETQRERELQFEREKQEQESGLAQLESSLNDFLVESNQKKALIAQLTTSNEQLRAEMSEKDTIISTLRDEAAARDSETLSLKEALSVRDGQAETLQLSLDTLQLEVTTLKEQLVTQQRESAAQVEELDSHLQELTAQLVEKHSQNLLLSAQASEANTQLNGRQRELDTLHDQIVQLTLQMEQDTRDKAQVQPSLYRCDSGQQTDMLLLVEENSEEHNGPIAVVSPRSPQKEDDQPDQSNSRRCDKESATEPTFVPMTLPTTIAAQESIEGNQVRATGNPPDDDNSQVSLASQISVRDTSHKVRTAAHATVQSTDPAHLHIDVHSTQILLRNEELELMRRDKNQRIQFLEKLIHETQKLPISLTQDDSSGIVPSPASPLQDSTDDASTLSEIGDETPTIDDVFLHLEQHSVQLIEEYHRKFSQHQATVGRDSNNPEQQGGGRAVQQTTADTTVTPNQLYEELSQERALLLGQMRALHEALKEYMMSNQPAEQHKDSPRERSESSGSKKTKKQFFKMFKQFKKKKKRKGDLPGE